MARFSEEWLSELLSKNDIVQVIGEYVTLTRKGSRFWASCPWHAERNPSFCVSPDKQMFYCFSCKKGGGVINFIMENEKLSYVEAVSLLAERVGMTLPEETGDEDYQKKKAYRKRLHGLMRELAVYYNHTLKGEEGREALAYMKRRGAAAQIMPFGLGYAKNSFDDALRFLKARGYTVREMLDAGVVKQKDGRVYDVFRNRVMFPIQNVFGDVIGFGGRVMDDGIPKYLNSGETVIFNKRYNLYALNTVKKRRNLKSILLVEGYMDVVALAAAGIATAVASLGTSLTKEQARLLKRYTEKVYLCYDGDDAGLNAALRGVDILEKEGLQVFVIVLPDKMDPDEFVKKYSADAFYALAKKAPAATNFRLFMLKRGFDMENPDEVVQYGTKAVELIRGLKNELEKERYIKFLSKETGISVESLFSQMGKGKEEKGYILPVKESNLIKKEAGEEARLLSFLMDNPQLLEKIRGLTPELFQNPAYKKIFFSMEEQIKRGILPSCAELVSDFSCEGGADLSELMACKPPDGMMGQEEYAEMLIRKLREARMLDKRQELIAKTATSTGEERAQLLREISALNREISKAEEDFRG